MKFLLLISFFLLTAVILPAQDATYFYAADFGNIENQEDAKYTKEINKTYGRRYVIKTFERKTEEWEQIRKERTRIVNDTLMRIRRKTDNIWSKGITRTFHPAKNDLYYFTDSRRGNILLEGYASSLMPLHLEDTVISYYTNGRLKSIAVYQDNHLVSNKNWLRNGIQYYDNLHHFVDQEPQHNLGQVHFRTYMLQGLKDAGIELNQISDNVLLGWVVMEDGSLEGFHTIQGAYSQLNELLIQLIREMPGEWLPARIDGKPVRYYMNMPFNFIDRTENFDNVEMSNGVLSWD